VPLALSVRGFLEYGVREQKGLGLLSNGLFLINSHLPLSIGLALTVRNGAFKASGLLTDSIFSDLKNSGTVSMTCPIWAIRHSYQHGTICLELA
jgi:hypothetical protein